MELFQILDGCQGIGPLIHLMKSVLGIIQFIIPALLIILGAIDLGKAVISSDDKEVKAAQGRLIKRVIYAVAVFFIVLLVQLVMKLVSDSAVNTGSNSNSRSWIQCWNNPDSQQYDN